MKKPVFLEFPDPATDEPLARGRSGDLYYELRYDERGTLLLETKDPDLAQFAVTVGDVLPALPGWSKDAVRVVVLGRVPLRPSLVAAAQTADRLSIGADRLHELGSFRADLPLCLTYKTRGELRIAKPVLARVHEVEVDVGTGRTVDEYEPIGDADLRSLAAASNLRRLDVRYRSKVTERGLETLARWEQLAILNLGGQRPQALENLAAPSALEALELDFSGTDATDSDIRAIGACEQLRRLGAGLNNPARTLRRLAPLTRLERLELRVTGAMDTSFLPSLGALEWLVLDAEAFSALPEAVGALKHLRALDVQGPVTDAVAAALAGSRALRSVELGVRGSINRPVPAKPSIPDTGLGDATLRSLAKAKGLRSLRTRGRFTDRGVRALAGLKELAHLSINGSLTPDGLGPLAELQNLRTVELSSPGEAAVRGLLEIHAAGHITSMTLSSPRPEAEKLFKKALGPRVQTNAHWGPRTVSWCSAEIERKSKMVARRLGEETLR